MAESDLPEEGLALLLQASREFAFRQIAEGLPLLPYATCVAPDGEMNFVRFAEPDTDLSPDEVLQLTEQELAQEAAKGGLAAAGVVSAVRLDAPEDGMADAIRIHVEAPGYCRQMLALYALGPADGEDSGELTLTAGKILPFDAEPVIFAD